MAMEKCYRDIQSRGQIAGLNLLEVFILIGVPLLLFPIFTLLKLSFGIVLIIEILLYTLFRLAARVSHFDYGLVSFVFSKFLWPKHLSAFGLDEIKYIKDDEKNFQNSNNKIQTNSKNQKPNSKQKIQCANSKIKFQTIVGNE
jgi:hypothetical protein